MYGARPVTRGSLMRSAVAFQSRNWPVVSVTVTCEITPRMRPRSSLPKPFITDSVVMSAVMPRVMPAMEMSEMKEMKWVRRRARV